jgi:RNA polymerase sigma-54 factor
MSPPDLRQGLSARTEQQMLLQPRMLQSIEVLQLAACDLEGWLQQAAEENEALLVEAPEWERSGPPASREATDRHDEMLRNQPDRERSLAEALEEQLCLMEFGEGLEEWVRFLIPCLDSNGYLSPSDEELLDLAVASGLEPDPRALGLAIARLQRFDPKGIGGRDMTEALLLQLDPAADDYSLLCRLLEEFLEEIAANRLPRVAKELGVEFEELTALLSTLRHLDPRPGAEATITDVPVLRPDVVVEREEGGGWNVRVERSSLPSVSLDPELVALARDGDSSAEIKGWARDRIERARWIVSAVGQRRQTLLRVAIEVFERQRKFLDEGPGHLSPLKMGEIAEELELHLSTISRAVSGKHVQTPAGVFPLRYFFQGAVGAGEGIARDDVREVVRRIFAEEDPREPLSDEEVVKTLGEKGVVIARRTVAKYRGELGILSSYRRKRQG